MISVQPRGVARLASALGILFCLALAKGCDRSESPLTVGFAGGLTGRHAALGISGRNGVQLAIETVNRNGGIGGRPVELLIEDDRQTAQGAVAADRKLMAAGAVAIIGHMTSTMTTAALAAIDDEEILLISPTASTHDLSGIDDALLRVVPSNVSETDALARYAGGRMKLRRMAAIYDRSNLAYTEPWVEHFRSTFQEAGGRLISVRPYTSGPDTVFAPLTREVLADQPDGMLLVTGALDAAMICQQIRKHRRQVPILICGWAKTHDFLRHGGPAVEGVIASEANSEDSEAPAYRSFVAQYQDRFSRRPDFAALYSYEAARVLFYGLSRSDRPAGIKRAIIGKGTFPGLQGDFRIDRWGDAHWDRFIIQVRDNKLRKLE
jgi:branched-chain amino acid transport system substrate-binding protein